MTFAIYYTLCSRSQTSYDELLGKIFRYLEEYLNTLRAKDRYALSLPGI